MVGYSIERRTQGCAELYRALRGWDQLGPDPARARLSGELVGSSGAGCAGTRQRSADEHAEYERRKLSLADAARSADHGTGEKTGGPGRSHRSPACPGAGPSARRFLSLTGSDGHLGRSGFAKAHEVVNAKRRRLNKKGRDLAIPALGWWLPG